jgi:5-methylcytosine-specific restriction endonuclease McrA
MTCTRCGASFYASPTGGRPRSRCDRCRSNHARADGTVWRKLRAQVLSEEPTCYIVGCGWPSTQVDHVLPLKLRPDLALVRSNLRGICATHNASKGARLMLPVADEEACHCRYPQRHYCLCTDCNKRCRVTTSTSGGDL